MNRRTRVLIAGGGVAALEAMVALRELAEDRVELTLLAPDKDFVYRPLAVAEPFGLACTVRFPLGKLTADCGAEHVKGAVSLVHPEERRVSTTDGRSLEYDALLVACGACPCEALPGATMFGGPGSEESIRVLLEDLDIGIVRRVALAVPTGLGWALPLYELALLTAGHVAQHELAAEVILITPEEEPLAVFGPAASAEVRSLMTEHGVELRTGVHAISFRDGRLALVGAADIEADRVVTLPRLAGRPVVGLPYDGDGFIPTDRFGRVEGCPDVYAAGDGTTFPIKQGGIAAQQADAAAEAIAAEVGAEVSPTPFEPVLRGLLLTGGKPEFLRAEVGGGHGESSKVDSEPLWWPASKIAAKYLASYLAAHTGGAGERRSSGLLL